MNLLQKLLQKTNTEQTDAEFKQKFGDEILLEEIKNLKKIQKGIIDHAQENLKEEEFQELSIDIFTEDEMPEALEILNTEFNHLLQINFEDLENQQKEELVVFDSKWEEFNQNAGNNLPDQEESDITLSLAKPDNRDDPNDDINLNELKEQLDYYPEATDKYDMTLDELKTWLNLYDEAIKRRFVFDAISPFPREEKDYLEKIEQNLNDLALQLKNYRANESTLPDSFKNVINSAKKDIKTIELAEKTIRRSKISINIDIKEKLNLAFDSVYTKLLSLNPEIKIEHFSTTQESTWEEIEKKFKEYDEIYQKFRNKNSDMDALGFFEKREKKERINNINNSLIIITKEIKNSKSIDPDIREKLNLVLQSAYEKLVALGEKENIKPLILDKYSTLADVRKIFTDYNRAYEAIEKKPLEIVVFDFIKANKIQVAKCHNLVQKIKEKADVNSIFKSHENLKNIRNQLLKDQKFYGKMTKVLSDNLKLNDKADNEKIENHEQNKEKNENEINYSIFNFMMYSFYTSITLFQDLKDEKSLQLNNSHQEASNNDLLASVDNDSPNESFKNIKTESYSVRMIFLAISLQLNYHFGLDSQLQNQNIQKHQLEKINKNIQNNPKCEELNSILGLPDTNWIMFRIKTFVTVLTVHINNSNFTSKERDNFLKTFNDNLFNKDYHSNDFLGKEIDVFDKAITVFKKRVNAKNYSIVEANIKAILVGSLSSLIKETDDNSVVEKTKNSSIDSYESIVDSPPFLYRV